MQTINKPLFKIALLSLSLCFASTAMAKIYKWTDASGKTHYTATPPPAKAKAKTEEFKVQKVKKSSLTNNSYAEDRSSRRSKSKSTKKRASAQSQCSKAVRKYPVILSKLKRKLNQGKAAGKINEMEYQKALGEIQKEKSKVQSVSDCVRDYKRGGKDANSVNLIANNSAEDALTYLMLGAAFEQAESKYSKTKKK